MNVFSITDVLSVVTSDTLCIIRQDSVNTILTPAKVEPDRHREATVYSEHDTG